MALNGPHGRQKKRAGPFFPPRKDKNGQGQKTGKAFSSPRHDRSATRYSSGRTHGGRLGVFSLHRKSSWLHKASRAKKKEDSEGDGYDPRDSRTPFSEKEFDRELFCGFSGIWRTSMTTKG